MRSAVLLLLTGLSCFGQDIAVSYDETSGSFSVVDPDGGRNNKFPKLWHRRDLFNFVTGEPPMYFFTRETFAKQKDRLAASYGLATCVAKATFGVPMSDYRWLTDDRMVQQSEFENGVVATVNFGDRPFAMADGFALPGGGSRMERRR